MKRNFSARPKASGKGGALCVHFMFDISLRFKLAINNFELGIKSVLQKKCSQAFIGVSLSQFSAAILRKESDIYLLLQLDYMTYFESWYFASMFYLMT